MLLPLGAVGQASAGSTGPEPTALTVSPTTAYAAASGSATFNGTLLGADGGQAHGVYFVVTSGPDANVANPLAGTACNVTNGSFSCTVSTSPAAGIDTVRFFYDAAATGSYVSPDQTATASLSISGIPTTAALSPISTHAGAAGYEVFKVAVTDASGRPVVGQQVNLTAAETGVLPSDIDVTATQPAVGATFTGTGSGGGTGTTADGTAGTNAGTATFYVASRVAGTVHLTSSVTVGPTVTSTASLTVDPAGADDATTVQITPGTQKAFTNGLVQQNISVLNSAGDPIAGVVPKVVVTGADDGQPVAVGPTDGTGTTVATYPTLALVGSDHVLAYVNQGDHTVNTDGLDPGEPSGTAAVDVGVEHFSPQALSNSGPVTVPAEITSAPVTFTLHSNDGSSAAGYGVNLTVSGGSSYTLSAANGVTDANGNVTVTVTNSSPSVSDTVYVIATLVGDGGVGTSTPVSWVTRTAVNPIISPFAVTSKTGTSVTHSVSITDPFGGPIPGVTFSWSVQGRNNTITNPGATGTVSTFTYTDTGRLNISDTDSITVTALNAAGGVIGTDTINQYWVIGTALAAQAQIDVAPFNGYYGQAIFNGPFVPINFTKTTTVAASGDPTPAQPTSAPHPVAVRLIDANGTPLYGKVVHFTSSGVGGFTNADGVPIGNSTTALVADGSGANGEENPLPTAPQTANPMYGQWATVFVRSTIGGNQLITATVDGIVDSGIVTYTDDYVPVSPVRVLDSRTGVGGLYGDSGPVIGRQLAPNTEYWLYYSDSYMPENASAYAFNVTAIHPSGSGYLRIDSECQQGQGRTSSLINYQAGKDIANFVILPASCYDAEIFSSNASVAVAMDLVGYYPNRGGTNIQSNASGTTRVVDTRIGLGGGHGPVLANTTRSFQISGTNGVPAGAKAVAINVTAIAPSGNGHLRIYPDGSALPNASSINYVPGVTKAAFVIVDLPPNGKIDVYSGGSAVDLAMDTFAYYPVTSTMVTAAPVRILDTRTGSPLAANTARTIQVTGLAGVPADAQAVLMTVTSIHTKGSTGGGSLRVFPAGASMPNVSTLNYLSPTSDVANFTIAQLGVGGRVTLYTAGSATDVAVDVVGYIPANPNITPIDCSLVNRSLRLNAPSTIKFSC